MIIDTNGFEIGNEVWWWNIDYQDGNKLIYNGGIIHAIIYNRHGVYINLDDKYDTNVHIDICFHSADEIKDYCNKMNGVNNG